VNPIGLVTYGLNRNPAGIARYARELLSALAYLGLSPLLLQSGDSVDGFHSIRLRGARLLPGLLTLGQIEIGLHSRWHGLELIHDPTGTAPLLLSTQKRVVTIHDALPFIYPDTSSTLDWLVYHYWLPYATRFVDQIVTDSSRSKSDIARFLGVQMERITVIPLAAGKQFRPLPEDEVTPVLERIGIQDHYILFVGSLEPRKNLINLLEAYTLLLNWSSEWNLVIVGARNFWKSESSKKFVEQHNLKSYVHFLGYIPDEDLPALYNGADLFVFPSLYEGFGLPVLESMACGTPVVTSNTSSLPEVAGDAAYLVDPQNVEEIADALKHVLSDVDLANDLRSRGLERAQNFTWEKTASQTIAVYEQALGRKLI
jgi:glycosyltransferase involved in cell wall biosynthesis